MPPYHKHRDYVSERKMRGWSCPHAEDYRAEQRRINFDIRLEYYAKRQNAKQFVKMVEIWADGYKFPHAGLPTLTLMKYAKLAFTHFGYESYKLGPTISNMVTEYLRLRTYDL